MCCPLMFWTPSLCNFGITERNIWLRNLLLFLSILLFINLDFPWVCESAPYSLTFACSSFLGLPQGYFQFYGFVHSISDDRRYQLRRVCVVADCINSKVLFKVYVCITNIVGLCSYSCRVAIQINAIVAFMSLRVNEKRRDKNYSDCKKNMWL